MTAILKGKRIDQASTLMELTRAAFDMHGKTWPAGTLYQPIFYGNDASGRPQQIVTVKGVHVVFPERR